MIEKIFLYRGPHKIHLNFAKSVNAVPYSNYLVFNYKRLFILFIPFVFIFRLITLPNAKIYLCEDGYSIILAIFRNLFNKKTQIVWMISTPIFYKIDTSINFFKKFSIGLFKKVTGAIAVSELNYKYARKYLSCKIKIVYPYVDTTKFSFIKNTYKNINFCYLGKITKNKGIDNIIELFEKIKKNYKNIELYLCGEADRNYKNIIKKYNWSGSWVINPKMYFKKCLIFLHLPIYDSFGTSVLEAMYCGLIPVVNNNVGIKYLIEDKLDKKLIINDSIKSFNFIKSILNYSDNEKLVLSRKCHDVASKFNKKNQILKFQRAFLKLTG